MAGDGADPLLVRRTGHPYLGGCDRLYAGARLHALHAGVFPDESHPAPGENGPDRSRSGGAGASAAQGRHAGQRPVALPAQPAGLHDRQCRLAQHPVRGDRCLAPRPDQSGEHAAHRRLSADEALQFRNHYSGGNSSRMGFFSMFYGLPSTYWQAFNDTQRQPVLMDQLAARGYEITGFSSVGFGSPSRIDHTLFAAVDAKVSVCGTARQRPERRHHPRLASVVRYPHCTGAAVVQPALLRSRQRGQRHRRQHGGAAHPGRAGSCLHAWHQGHRS